MLHHIQVTQEVLDASVVNPAAAVTAGTDRNHQIPQQEQQHQQQQEGLEAEARASVRPVQPSCQQEQQQGVAVTNSHGQQQQEKEVAPAAAATAAAAHASQQPAQSLQPEQQQQAGEAAQKLASSNVQGQHCTQMQAKSSAECGHSNLCFCGSEPGGGAGLGSSGPEVVARAGERVSLTIRRVLKVHKALGFMGR